MLWLAFVFIIMSRLYRCWKLCIHWIQRLILICQKIFAAYFIVGAGLPLWFPLVKNSKNVLPDAKCIWLDALRQIILVKHTVWSRTEWPSFLCVICIPHILCVIAQFDPNKYGVRRHTLLTHAPACLCPHYCHHYENWSWFIAYVVKVIQKCPELRSLFARIHFRFCGILSNANVAKEEENTTATTKISPQNALVNVTFSLPFVIINFYVRHIRRYIWPSIRW